MNDIPILVILPSFDNWIDEAAIEAGLEVPAARAQVDDAFIWSWSQLEEDQDHTMLVYEVVVEATDMSRATELRATVYASAYSPSFPKAALSGEYAQKTWTYGKLIAESDAMAHEITAWLATQLSGAWDQARSDLDAVANSVTRQKRDASEDIDVGYDSGAAALASRLREVFPSSSHYTGG